MIARRKIPRALLSACALGMLASTAGCGRTLVFAEHDSVNFGITANASSTPPIEVNFGLNRLIGTIVPPAGDENGRPLGEAVNMFAGFQVERFSDLNLLKPVGVDLRIVTQFASGAAALAVAKDADIVNRIANVNITHTAAYGQRPAILFRDTVDQQITGLTGPQRVRLANLMLPHLSSANQKAVEGLIPPPGQSFKTPKSAERFLRFLVQSSEPDPQLDPHWLIEIENAKK